MEGEEKNEAAAAPVVVTVFTLLNGSRTDAGELKTGVAGLSSDAITAAWELEEKMDAKDKYVSSHSTICP